MAWRGVVWREWRTYGQRYDRERAEEDSIAVRANGLTHKGGRICNGGDGGALSQAKAYAKVQVAAQQ